MDNKSIHSMLLLLMKTPIYIDYQTTYPTYLATNELDIYSEDPVDIYTDPTILDPLDTSNTLPYILAPRYYIEIHRPRNQPGPTITIPIHKSPNSLMKDKLRVSLDPSIGWGINASYKVDYWEWIPNVNLPAIPSKQRLSTQYWYIPTLDYNFVPRLPFDGHRSWGYPFDQWANIHKLIHPGLYPYFKPRLNRVIVEAQRTIDNDTVIDLITDVNGLKAFSFRQGTYLSFSEQVIKEQFAFNDETKSWTFSKAMTGSTLVRDLDKVDGDLIDGQVQTTIEYIEPFHPDQVTIHDCEDLLNDGLSYSPYFI